jgi:CRP/FNR family transcriptional regulator
VDAEAQSTLGKLGVWRQWSPSRVLFRQGQACDGVHLVTEGLVKLVRCGNNGREQILSLEGPGSLLAVCPLLDAEAYPLTAIAIRSTRTIYITRAEYTGLRLSSPALQEAFSRQIARRIRHLVQLVDNIALKTVDERVATLLVQTAHDAGLLEDGCEMTLPFNQEQMANEVASTRESVARALKRIVRAGLIEHHRGRVRFRDVSVLLEYAHMNADALNAFPRESELQTIYLSV